jgi:hypothetical protein
MEFVKMNAIGHSRKVMALNKGICLKPVPELKTWVGESST